MKEKIKVVFDTNVLVSALWSDVGNTAEIVELIPISIIPCFSDAILLEYTEVLNRPKFDFSEHKRNALFSQLNEYGELHSSNKSDILLPDESDRIFYDTAKASGAILITGNLKHYPKELFIMTPAEFLSKLKTD